MARRKAQAAAPETTTVTAPPADNETLVGTSTLPAEIEVAEGVTIQLGELVMLAHKTSGLSIEAWNALQEDERDGLLAKELEEAKSALASSPQGTASNGSQTGFEPASKTAKASGSHGQPAGHIIERTFRALSRVKQNGARISAGDPITLDRAGFEEMRRCRVVEGAFEDGEPVQD